MIDNAISEVMKIVAEAIRELLGPEFAETLGFHIGEWLLSRKDKKSLINVLLSCGIIVRDGKRGLEVEVPSAEPLFIGIARAIMHERYGKVEVLVRGNGRAVVRYDPPPRA